MFVSIGDGKELGVDNIVLNLKLNEIEVCFHWRITVSI